jgi:hypothetical protein
MALTNPQLVLSTVPTVLYGPTKLPVVATFVNAGPTPVRLLDRFEPVPVFFTFDVVRADGTPLPISGGGKIDFGPNEIRYLELPPGGSHSVQADLAKLLRLPVELGPYSVSATYHNQYGENCFLGGIRSNTILLQVTEPGVKP